MQAQNLAPGLKLCPHWGPWSTVTDHIVGLWQRKSPVDRREWGCLKIKQGENSQVAYPALPQISDGAWTLNIPASLSGDETPAFPCPGDSPPRWAPRPSPGRALHFLVFHGFSPTLSTTICCPCSHPTGVQFHRRTAPRRVKSRDKVDGGSQAWGRGLVFNEVPSLGRGVPEMAMVAVQCAFNATKPCNKNG